MFGTHKTASPDLTCRLCARLVPDMSAVLFGLLRFRYDLCLGSHFVSSDLGMMLMKRSRGVVEIVEIHNWISIFGKDVQFTSCKQFWSLKENAKSRYQSEREPQPMSIVCGLFSLSGAILELIVNFKLWNFKVSTWNLQALTDPIFLKKIHQLASLEFAF